MNDTVSDGAILSYARHLLISAQQRPTALPSIERSDTAWFILLWLYVRAAEGLGARAPGDLRGSHLPAAMVSHHVAALVKADYLIPEPSVSDKKRTSYRLHPDVAAEVHNCLRAELTGLTQLLCREIPRPG